MCGHSSQESADSIKIVANLINTALQHHLHFSAPSNYSGGGAIQHVYLKLIEMRVMPRDSKCNHYNLHGLNKPLEEGLKQVLGNSGIGRNMPWQLLFVADLFLDHLVEVFTEKNLNEMWSDINTIMMDNVCFRKKDSVMEVTILGFLRYHPRASGQ
jgi:hypothetical protein